MRTGFRPSKRGIRTSIAPRLCKVLGVWVVFGGWGLGSFRGGFGGCRIRDFCISCFRTSAKQKPCSLRLHISGEAETLVAVNACTKQLLAAQRHWRQEGGLCVGPQQKCRCIMALTFIIIHTKGHQMPPRLSKPCAGFFYVLSSTQASG